MLRTAKLKTQADTGCVNPKIAPSTTDRAGALNTNATPKDDLIYTNARSTQIATKKVLTLKK